MQTHEELERLMPFSGGLIQERISRDARGVETKYRTLLDRTNALVTTETLYPDGEQSVPAQEIRHGGRLESSRSKSKIVSTYKYDSFGRTTETTDGRGNTQKTFYDTAGRVASTEDGANHVTTYAYYAATDADPLAYPGRLKSVQNAKGLITYHGYDERGRQTHTWGDVPYPTRTEYNDYDQVLELHTYRSGTGWSGPTWPGGTGDVTSWTYHAPTGLLNAKVYPGGTYVLYEYKPDGRLWKRRWARDAAQSLYTTYGYDEKTAEVTSVTYDQAGMVNLAYEYNRLGKRKTVTDAAGTRRFEYDPVDFQPTIERFDTGPGNLLPGFQTTHLYQDGTGPPGSQTVAGRLGRFEIGTTADPDAYYALSYGYYDDLSQRTGRLKYVQGPGLPAGDPVTAGARYYYLLNTDLVSSVQYVADDGSTKYRVAWSYEDKRELVHKVSNKLADTALAEYTYGQLGGTPVRYDELGRRRYEERGGVAFNPGFYEAYQYDNRSELWQSSYFTGTYPTGTAVPAENEVYEYDPIGNRTTASRGTLVRNYERNELNQYDRVTVPGSSQFAMFPMYDLDGNMKEAGVAGDMNCSGTVDFNDIAAFVMALSDPVQYAATYPGCDPLRGDINGDGVLNFDDMNAFVALLGSNPAPAAVYKWDAENRLVEVGPASDVNVVPGTQKAQYLHDYLGRRVQKQVWTYSGGWTGPVVRRYVYEGWRPVLELDGENNVLRKYTWGLDLAGQAGSVNSLGGAGGVGGLLAVQDTNGTPGNPADDLHYAYGYDAGGNVGVVVDWSHDPGDPAGAIKAVYDYTPYGTVRTASGSFAATNPFRYSTKITDDESGLIDFGRRHYNPGLGRWMSRDPADELGGTNLYAFVANDPANQFDYLGLMCGPRPENCGKGGCPGTLGGPQSRPAQSQPTTSQPGLDLEPYRCLVDGEDRTCKGRVSPKAPGFEGATGGICAEACKLRYKSEGLYGGLTACDDNGKACCCVCGATVGAGHFGELPGIKECVAQHEAVHVRGSDKRDGCRGALPGEGPGRSAPEECDAYDKQSQCIADSMPQGYANEDDLARRIVEDAADVFYNNCFIQCKHDSRCWRYANRIRQKAGLVKWYWKQQRS